jgi:hypothetical protein
MKICRAYIESMPGSPYSQSGMHRAEMKDRESHDDYDERTWLEKCTVNSEGHIAIPAMAAKQCVDTAAQKLGMKIPGRRGATYKNYFASGVISQRDIVISANGKPLTKTDAEKVVINANADGVRGSGKRVTRRFPSFPKWNGTFEFLITDDIITTEVFETHVKAGGIIVAIGRFRAEKGGTNGRFLVKKFEWEDFQL